jgi:hypothetical protein
LKEETLNILDSLDEEDDAKVEEALDALYFILGGDELAQSTLEEIIKFRSFASDELIRWLANLYDPETGGFYYSNSGRNTIGYAPDIESTEQALNLLSSSGALSAIGYSPANLPSWMKEALVNWIKPMPLALKSAIFPATPLRMRMCKPSGTSIPIVAPFPASMPPCRPFPPPTV